MYKLVLICFSFFVVGVKAQDEQLKLKVYSDSLRFCKVEASRYAYNDSFKQLLSDYLSLTNDFKNLDTVRNTISVLLSPDQKCRVISWVYISDKEEYTNHCVVQYKRNKNAELVTNWLTDFTTPLDDSVYNEFTATEWPGALYYQIYESKRKGVKYYILLGLNGQNSFSNQKIIDVFWFDKNEELHIGAPLFYDSKKDYTPRYRVYFNYADQGSCLLRFEPKAKIITFTHLVPSNPSALGLNEYYIPDGRIDYYKLTRKGKWIKYEDLSKFDFLSD